MGFRLRDHLQIGGKKDHVAIEHDGFIRLDGNATFFDDEPACDYVTAASNGATATLATIGTAMVGIVWSFSAAAENSLHAKIVLPPSYKAGSLVKILADWVPAAANAGKVNWNLSYSYHNPGAATTTTDPTAVDTVFTLTNDLKAQSSLLATLPETNFVPGTVLHLTLLRDGDDATNDTHTAAAWLSALKARFECDTLGLRTAAAK